MRTKYKEGYVYYIPLGKHSSLFLCEEDTLHIIGNSTGNNIPVEIAESSYYSGVKEYSWEEFLKEVTGHFDKLTGYKVGGKQDE